MSTQDTAHVTVPVYYDFASTVCCVAHHVTRRIAGDLDALAVDLVWVPVDLTLMTDWRRGDRLRGRRRANAQRIADELRVSLQPPEQWMDSRGAMVFAMRATGTAAEVSWRDAVWRSIYEEGLSLDDPELLPQLAGGCGLDPVLPTSSELEALESQTRDAMRAGVVGVPTFLLDVWPVGGIQEDETMVHFLRRFVERRRQRPPVVS